jgi:hypothetical protein
MGQVMLKKGKSFLKEKKIMFCHWKMLNGIIPNYLGMFMYIWIKCVCYRQTKSVGWVLKLLWLRRKRNENYKHPFCYLFFLEQSLPNTCTCIRNSLWDCTRWVLGTFHWYDVTQQSEHIYMFVCLVFLKLKTQVIHLLHVQQGQRKKRFRWYDRL